MTLEGLFCFSAAGEMLSEEEMMISGEVAVTDCWSLGFGVEVVGGFGDCKAEPATVDDGWSLGFGGEGGAGEPVAKMKLVLSAMGLAIFLLLAGLSVFAFLPRFLDGVFCD